MNTISQKKRTKRRVLENGGIYSITCTANGKVYIGSTVDFKRRWSQHLGYLKKGEHHSPYLQRSYNKYGLESFDFQIVEHIKYADELLDAEQRWIYWFQAHDREKGFNQCSVAGSTANRVREVWEKEKISHGLHQFNLTRQRLKKEKEEEDYEKVRKNGVSELSSIGLKALENIAQIYKIEIPKKLLNKCKKDKLVALISAHPFIDQLQELMAKFICDRSTVLESIPDHYQLFYPVIAFGLEGLKDLDCIALNKIASLFRVCVETKKGKTEEMIFHHPMSANIREIAISNNKIPPKPFKEVNKFETIVLSEIDFDAVFANNKMSLEHLSIRDLKKIASTYGIYRYSDLSKELIVEKLIEHPQLCLLGSILTFKKELISSDKELSNHKRRISKEEATLLILNENEYQNIIQNGLEAISSLSIRSLKLAARFYGINAYSYMTRNELINSIKKSPKAIYINTHVIKSDPF